MIHELTGIYRVTLCPSLACLKAEYTKALDQNREIGETLYLLLHMHTHTHTFLIWKRSNTHSKKDSKHPHWRELMGWVSHTTWHRQPVEQLHPAVHLPELLCYKHHWSEWSSRLPCWVISVTNADRMALVHSQADSSVTQRSFWNPEEEENAVISHSKCRSIVLMYFQILFWLRTWVTVT